jgi:hypothetical protein
MAFFQWGGETAHPKYKIVPTSANSLSQTFCESKLKKIEASYFDFSQKPNGTYNQAANYYTFNASKQLEEIEDIGMCDTFNYYATFGWCSKLHTIAVMRVAEGTTFVSVFNGCPKLKNIKIEGTIGQNGLDFSACKELSADSIRSIITHLSDTAQGKTLTLSKAAVEKMDISDVHVSTTGPFSTTGGTFLPACKVSMRAGERIKVTLDVAEGHHYNDFYSDAQPDWAVGFSFNGKEPYNREETYTAETDGTVYIGAYIQTRKACEFTFKIRAVFVDADGNEIDGENIFSIADGDYSYEDQETGAITNYTVKSDWAAIEASKPNWTINLV